MADGSKLPIDVIKEAGEEEFQVFLEEFWDFSLYHGNQMKIHTDPVTEPYKCHTSSSTLVPTRLSKSAYEKALAVMPIFNTLYHKVATDKEFLLSTLQSVRSHDQFLEKLIEIYERLQDENSLPSIYLGLNRSDYLCHMDGETLKQVEFNTIAAAASGVNRAASLWHRYVAGTLMQLDNSHIPESNATNLIAQGMVKSWELYSNPQSVIVFLITGRHEFNFADQRSLQYDIHQLNKKITIMRVQFDTLNSDNLTVDADRKLFINGREVAIVYLRAGYSPKHYPSDTVWHMRYLIEKSIAIKCPSVAYQLAGSKIFQQVLAKPGVMERWLDADSCQALREMFMGFHSFGKEDGGEESVVLAKQNPEKYVMKPQRDGGGNNLHNDDITAKINSASFDELSAYTLMEKILPPTNENYVVCSGDTPPIATVVSELGIFGSYIVAEGNVVMNKGAGFLFRSKQSDRNEGDLMRGTSSLDSPWLL